MTTSQYILNISVGVLLLLWGVRAQIYNLPSQCYPLVDHANNIVQSIGADSSILCATSGIFSSALQAITSCLNIYAGSGDRQVATLLSAADSFCSGKAPAAVLAGANSGYFRSSICCGIDTGAQFVANCSTIRTVLATEASCAAYTPAITTNTTTSPSSAAIATVSSGQSATAAIATQSSAPTSASDQSATKPNTGLMAGAAVGVSIGFVIIVLAVFFIFWHRRQRKRTFERSEALERDRPSEKPELHAVDYKPEQKELPGTPVINVRTVGGLEELEAIRWKGHELSETQGIDSSCWTDTSRSGVQSERSWI